VVGPSLLGGGRPGRLARVRDQLDQARRDAPLFLLLDSLLLAYALLWREDDLAGAGLAALSALTGVISTLTAWNDVCYTAMHGRRGLRRHRDRV